TDALRYRPLPVDPVVLAEGLTDALGAPLGGPLRAHRLCDISRADRLDELEFHLPLGRLRADHIAEVLLDHLDDHDPLRPWATHVASRGFEIDVEGMLTGSLDVVARVDGRYVVADYK